MEIRVSNSGSANTVTVTLHHGSALVCCNSIAVEGVSSERMKALWPGTGPFCTSTSPEVARGYALLNPLVRMKGHTPAMVKFGFPRDTLELLQANKLVSWVPEDQAYEFSPETFARVNRERMGVSVLVITEMTTSFEE